MVAAHGGEVLALDYAWPMLRAAQAKTRREGHPNLSFVRARAEQLPCASGTLAGVLCGGSLNEFGSQGAPRVLHEVARALQAGGVGFFMHLLRAEPGVGRWAQRTLAEPGGVAFWDREASRRLFEAAGLTVEAEQAFGVVAFTRVRRG